MIQSRLEPHRNRRRMTNPHFQIANSNSPGPSECEGPWPVPNYDHNGNIVRYVSESGAVAAEYVYDPYGGIAEESGTLAAVFTFGFSTKPLDRETGLIAYQRRFYKPAIGRWINRDPIEEGGGENLYALVENNPVLFVDPFGLQLPYLGGIGDPVSLPYYENTPPYGPYYPNPSDGLDEAGALLLRAGRQFRFLGVNSAPTTGSVERSPWAPMRPGCAMFVSDVPPRFQGE